MSLTETIADLITGGQLTEAGQAIEEMREHLAVEADGNFELRERLAELELALEDIGWVRMAAFGEQEFSRSGLDRMVRICRLMALKNPLIQRSINVQAYYVWALGLSIKAAHHEIDNVIQDYLDEKRNKKELVSTQAREYKERELSTTGNLYLAHFVNFSTGKVRTRSFPYEEIVEVIKNPDDDKEPLYYKRTWQERYFNPMAPAPAEPAMSSGFTPSQPGGMRGGRIRTAYYADFQNVRGQHPAHINGIEVIQNVYIQHVKDGGFEHWDFGVPWVYAGVDWAKAYKEFLEDTASIWRAYKRFAVQLKTKGGKKGVQKAKDKLNSTLSTDMIERKPAPASGSIFVGADGKELSVIRTAGATTSPSDARQLLLMVCAAAGLPETFYGDVQTGNLATAKSLDRPTELKFIMRQSLWKEIFSDTLDFVIDQAASAINGPILGEVAENDWGELDVVMPIDEDTGEPISRDINFTWPPILQHDVGETVSAIATANTLGTNSLQGTMDKRTLSTLMLSALPGVTNVAEIVERLYPDDAGEEPATSQATPAPTAESDSMTVALRNLREVIESVGEKYAAALSA